MSRLQNAFGIRLASKTIALSCAVDDVTYGGLRKIGFTRTQTLGNGDDCCDFHFFRK